MSARLRSWSLLIAATAMTLVFTVQQFRYGDEWWHIALGRIILQDGIPAQEPFSFVTTQHPWVEQQWLFEVLLAKLVDIFGAGGASLAMGLVGSAALLVAALAIPRDTGVSAGWRATAIVVGGIVASPVMGVRGEVMSMLGVALTLLILSRWRDGSRRAVWLLPPLFLLWANVHAGFIAGLAILVFTLLQTVRAVPAPRTWLVALGGLAAGLCAVIGGLVVGVAALVVLLFLLGAGTGADAERRPLLIATVAAALATLLNPAGPGLYGYVVETFSNPLLGSAVSEWQSPDFHDTFNRIFELSAVALVALAMLSPRRRVDQLLLAGGAFLAALQAVRNVPLFSIIAIPQLAENGAAAWDAHVRVRRRRRPAPAVMTAVLAGVIVVASLVTVSGSIDHASTAGFEADREPEAAATYVGLHHPGARLLSSDTDGGYLAYRFPAARVVFIYPEIGIFGESTLTDYLDIVALRTDDWYARIAAHGIHTALLPAGQAMTSALLEKGWVIECAQRVGTDPESGWVVMHDGGPPPTGSRPSPAQAPAC